MVPGGQMAMTENIENYPGFERIDGFTLAEKMKSAAEAAGAPDSYGRSNRHDA